MTEHTTSQGPTGEHTVAELAAAFRSMPAEWAGAHVQSIGLDVSDGELSVMQQWDRMTRDVVGSKFDCLVSRTLDSSTFDGLNSSITERYLSDDPAHAFEIPSAFELGRLGRLGTFSGGDGYHFFDYADFERLLLEEDAFFDEDFRDEVYSQRKRSSLFSKRPSAAATRPTRARRRAASPAGAPGTPESGRPHPDGTTTGAEDVAHDLEAAFVEQDPTWVHAYPAAMGRAGSTLIPRAQRQASRMLPRERRQEVARLARVAGRNGLTSGPAVAPNRGGDHRPTWAPITFDAAAEASLPKVARAPMDEIAVSAETLGAAMASSATARSTAKPAMLDGLAISRQHFPALTGALDVAGAAFATPEAGAAAAPAAMPGVFSPGRLESALRVVSMSQGDQAIAGLRPHVDPAIGYHGLLYDAVDHTWVAAEQAAPMHFDAADLEATPQRAGRSMSARAAAPRLIANALPVSAPTGRTASAATGPAPAQTTPQRIVPRTEAHRLMQSSPTSAGQLFGGTSPVVAPVAELAGLAPSEVEQQLLRHLPPASQRADVRPSFGAVPGTRSRPVGDASAPNGLSLSQLVRDAQRVERGARRLGAGAALSQVAAAQPTAATGSPGFVARLGRRGAAMGVTSTGPELFAADHARQTRGDIASLVRPEAGPVTTAGEVHTGYHSIAGAFDDPVVYLAPEHSGAKATTGGLFDGHRLPASVAKHLQSLAMPLSSASALGQWSQDSARAHVGFDASAPEAQAAGSARLASPVSAAAIGATVRSDGGIVSQRALRAVAGQPLAATGRSEQFAPEAAELSTLTPMVPPVAAAAGTDGLFYEFSYDPETAWLRNPTEGPAVSGQHVEVRDGRIVRAVPASATSARRMAQPAAAGASAIQTATPTRTWTEQLAGSGIQAADTQRVVTGQSRLEAGFPALSLSADGQQSTRTGSIGLASGPAAVVAGATEAELAMMPPMVREMLARQTRAAQSMTAGGTDSAGLIERLARVADPTSPGARSALMRELALMGVDTPELLRVLDAAPAGVQEATLRDATTRATSGDAPRGGATSGAQPSATTGRPTALGGQPLAQIVSRLTGVPAAASAESSVAGDAYWGDFAPSRVVHRGAADLLKSILGRPGLERSVESRPSALAYGAEMGEMLALGGGQKGRGGAGTANIAQATMFGRRVTSSGAPTRAAELARTAVTKRRREQAIASRADSLAAQILTTRQSDADAASARAEAFSDRVGGAVAESLRTGSAATAAGLTGTTGWDDDMTLTAVKDDSTSLAARIGSAATPWEAASGTSGAPRTAPGTPRSDSPLARALQGGRHADLPSRTSPLSVGSTDLGPVGRLLASDGPRGFASLGSAQAREILEHLPTRRALASALGGNLDLTMAVIDRANGAFANLDAGVRAFLSRRAGGSDLAEEAVMDRDLRPGLDDWPAETMDMLRSAGWGIPDKDGDIESAPPVSRPRADEAGSRQAERIQRLERSLGAAKAAYTRLASARSHSGSARATDNIDWSLVDTGAESHVPQQADLGRLADTMVRTTDVPAADLSYVAPAVKVVAQQAQLHGSGDRASGSSGARPSTGPTAGGKVRKKAQKPDIEGLARQIHRRLQRRWAIDRERIGKF